MNEEQKCLATHRTLQKRVRAQCAGTNPRAGSQTQGPVSEQWVVWAEGRAWGGSTRSCPKPPCYKRAVKLSSRPLFSWVDLLDGAEEAISGLLVPTTQFLCLPSGTISVLSSLPRGLRDIGCWGWICSWSQALQA